MSEKPSWVQVRHELELDGTDYRGEEPFTRFDRSDEGLQISCLDWPDEQRAIDVMYAFVMCTWGEHVRTPRMGTEEQKRRTAELALTGKALPAVLQALQYTFSIEGVTRGTTHQLVRHQAGIVQHSQRANDERHAAVRLPLTIEKLGGTHLEAFKTSVLKSKEVYASLVDAGIPVEDARAVLPTHVETQMVLTWDYTTMQRALSLRMCHNSAPEMVMVAQKIRDEVRRVTPWLGQYLKIMCEWAGRCNYETQFVGHNDKEPCGIPFEQPTDQKLYRYTREQNGALMWLKEKPKNG